MSELPVLSNLNGWSLTTLVSFPISIGRDFCPHLPFCSFPLQIYLEVVGDFLGEVYLVTSMFRIYSTLKWLCKELIRGPYNPGDELFVQIFKRDTSYPPVFLSCHSLTFEVSIIHLLDYVLLSVQGNHCLKLRPILLSAHTLKGQNWLTKNSSGLWKQQYLRILCQTEPGLKTSVPNRRRQRRAISRCSCLWQGVR